MSDDPVTDPSDAAPAKPAATPEAEAQPKAKPKPLSFGSARTEAERGAATPASTPAAVAAPAESEPAAAVPEPQAAATASPLGAPQPVAEPGLAAAAAGLPPVAAPPAAGAPATATPLFTQNPQSMIFSQPSFTARFVAFYTLLGALIVGTIVAFVVFVVTPAVKPGAAWSTWAPPSGSTSSIESAIATHVAAEYKLNKGGAALLAVISGPLQVTSGTSKVAVPDIAVFTTPTSSNYQLFTTGSTWTYDLCGLGPSCAIASGQATDLRGQLVRREALELALYTFKYVSTITSLVAYMPPPPGSTAATVLYFQKNSFSKQLGEPLAKTLPLAQPPLPTTPDNTEASSINKLTLSQLYSYKYGALQSGGAVLELDPVLS